MKKLITICAAALVFLIPIQNIVLASAIYWTTAGHLGTNGISTAKTDGTGVTKLVSSSYPFDVAVGPGGEGLFWTDYYGTIGRANLDGSNQQTIIGGLGNPWGIAIDSTNQKLYWSDTSLNKIQRANFDGSSVEDVITGLSGPREIEVDPFKSKIYWVDNGFGEIKRSDLDGSGLQVLVSGLPSGSYGVSGMSLDLTNGVMYWAEDSSTGKIRRANLNGTGITDCIQIPQTQPVSVTVDALGGYLYWTDYTYGKIHRANLDGSGDEVLLNEYHPLGITFVPEPGTLCLLGFGALDLLRRRRA
jgi:DNA-binding beta-propeller fold protein YncE